MWGGQRSWSEWVQLPSPTLLGSWSQNNSKWNYDIVITRPDFVCMTQNQYKPTQEEIILQKLSDQRDDQKKNVSTIGSRSKAMP